MTKLVETMWLSKYPIPMEIMYDQGSEFIGYKFRKYAIEREHGITDNQSLLGNLTSKTILERIHQVVGNIVQHFNIAQTYVYEDCPWLVILAAAVFGILSKTNRFKGYSPYQ